MVEFSSSAALQHDLSGFQKFMKWIIMGLCGLYLIFSIVLIAVGAAAMNGNIAAVSGQTLPQGIIVIGVFLLLTSLLGAFSAYKEVRIGLVIYFVLMTIWTVILISIAIAVYAERNQAQNLIAGNWMSIPLSLQNTIQSADNCCGRNYYNESIVVNVNGFPVQQYTGAYPCPSNQVACGADNCAMIGAGGCVPILVSQFQSSFYTLGSCGIAFSVIMIVGLTFTCFLMRGIKDKGQANAIEANRARTERDLAERRKRGKGGLKIPDSVI